MTDRTNGHKFPTHVDDSTHHTDVRPSVSLNHQSNARIEAVASDGEIPCAFSIPMDILRCIAMTRHFLPSKHVRDKCSFAVRKSLTGKGDDSVKGPAREGEERPTRYTRCYTGESTDGGTSSGESKLVRLLRRAGRRTLVAGDQRMFHRFRISTRVFEEVWCEKWDCVINTYLPT